MGYVLGIDQGATKTCAAVADKEGNIISYHRTGGCYFPEDGIANATKFIFEATDSVMSAAGLKAADIDMAVAGVTGIDFSGDEVVVYSALKDRFSNSEIIACNDCEVAYYSGTLKPTGAVVCAGTGLNAALFAPSGQKFVMGDYLKGSLQGGSAITARAIEAVFESDLGALPETGLTKLFLEFSGDGSVSELLKNYIRTDGFPKKIIPLMPGIIGLASDGDKVTLGVLEAFTDELCACFIAAMRKMGMLELYCDIVLTGSVFMGNDNVLTAMVTKKLLQSAKNASIVEAGFEPIVGACIYGLLKKTGNLSTQKVQNITDTAEKAGLLRQRSKL